MLSEDSNSSLPQGEAGLSSARQRASMIHERIRQRICLLDYKPGEKLSEEALARDYGTSRTPIRRVLARLEDEGLVISVQGVGTFVTDADIVELRQVYQLRIELVELTGRLDPEPPDADMMTEFRQLAARSKSILAAPDPRAFTQLDMDFFQALMKLTANEPFRKVCERLYFQTKRIWLKHALASHIDLGQEAAIFDREISEIISALEAEDLVAVASIRKAHLSMSFHRLLNAAAKDERTVP